jgi:hypothetical protein
MFPVETMSRFEIIGQTNPIVDAVELGTMLLTVLAGNPGSWPSHKAQHRIPSLLG